MQKIRKIQNNVAEVIKVCIENYRSDQLKRKFEDSIDFILEYSNDFENKILENNIHNLFEHDNVANILSKEDMTKLYDRKFANNSSPGRKFYDQIILSAVNEKCPLCGVRTVSTLDHFLPKSKYPTLAVTPSNLIPACKDCNFIKQSKSITSQYNVPLHPYYDNLGDQIWLNVDINEFYIPKYFVYKPLNWDDVLFERVLNHFNSLELSKLYAVYAIDEITNYKQKWKYIKSRIGIDFVFEDIEKTLISFEFVDINSWKSALFRALRDNPIIICKYLET